LIKVLKNKQSVLGQFERRVISEDVSTSALSEIDDILTELTQDRFTLDKFKSIWLSKVNQNISENMIKVILKLLYFSNDKTIGLDFCIGISHEIPIPLIS